MNENIKDKETNSKNMDIQEFLDKCKTGNIDEKKYSSRNFISF